MLELRTCYLFVFASFSNAYSRPLVRGKPKRGRTGARDGKKVRQSSDLDPDDEDDTDLSLR